MSTAIDKFDQGMRRRSDSVGMTTVHRGELLRHPVYTRLLHWLVAIAFVLSLLSGFALYSPWLFRFLTPIFGGGPMARFLHPWFGLFFDIFFLFQFLNWFAPMAWTDVDRRWLNRIKQYLTNEDKVESAEVGFFNGGQKLYFWSIVLSGVLFIVTGLLMWFDHVVPRWIVALNTPHIGLRLFSAFFSCRPVSRASMLIGPFSGAHAPGFMLSPAYAG